MDRKSENNKEKKYRHLDSFLGNDSMTTMDPNSSLDDQTTTYDIRQSIRNSIYNNYNIGMTYMNNDNKKVKVKSEKEMLIPLPSEKEEESTNHEVMNTPETEEAIINNTTNTSLKLKDDVINQVDISSNSQRQNSSHSSSIIQKSNKSNSTISKRKSKGKIILRKSIFSKKEKSPSQEDTVTSSPKLINVPGESSMVKIYEMEDSTTQKGLENTASEAAIDDTIETLPEEQEEQTKLPENNQIKILSSHSTQKTSTYNYLPKELIDSPNGYMNIANFQIHTCKDSVLSPLIPCVACSNEKKWKNKRLSTKIRHRFMSWMVNLSQHNQKDKNSVTYTTSATMSVPIYFGDQKASPEDQNRHHHRHHSSSGSTSFISEKKWKSKSKSPKSSPSSPYFLFPDKATQNPLPIKDYPVLTPVTPTLNYVIGTKRAHTEILPIANDINKKNSNVRILNSPVSANTHAVSEPLPGGKSKSKEENVGITKSRSQIRPNPKSRDYYKNKHKGIIYYDRNGQNLENSTGSISNKSLEQNDDLTKSLSSSKITIHDGYNKSIFEQPITPELHPPEIEIKDDDILTYGIIKPPKKRNPSNQICSNINK